MSDIFVLEEFSYDSLNEEAKQELYDGLRGGDNPDKLRANVLTKGVSGSSDQISELSCYTLISPNKSARTAKIDRITIHHMAGNLTIEQCGQVFANRSRQASSNYGIGTDGRIACYVPENYRAWTSSSSANDNRAVTIEVANSVAADPWPVSEAAYESLTRLCVDICQRNGISAIRYTGDTTGNLTAHRWFAATCCPGPYLYELFPEIAKEVNKRLSNGSIMPVSESDTNYNQEDDDDMTYEKFCEYMDQYMSEAVVSKPSSWAKDACEKAIKNGVMLGDGNGAYNFQKPLTREAYLVMQDRQGLL